MRLVLVVIHHHFRPGGVRRVIELATPHLLAGARQEISRVILATGEAPEAIWLDRFRTRLAGREVRVFINPAFGYLSESEATAQAFEAHVADGVRSLLGSSGTPALFWAHNLGLGRNFCLARQLTRQCHRARVALVLHHHDWWLENRWHLVKGSTTRRAASLRNLARAVLATSPHIAHAAINASDARVLRASFGRLSGWLPNPVEQTARVPAGAVKVARRWLEAQLGETAPVWLLPCRLLRRKNIAEALLLARWLRPEAWLVTTGGPSSAEEQPYARALREAGREHGWRLRLALLQGQEAASPPLPELMAASECILLTSLQEGFGLPYLEAAAARVPLIARELPQVGPDLKRFGFRFPQAYRELWVDPSLFDWRDEWRRQTREFSAWRQLIPRPARRHVGVPALLASRGEPGPVPFSRLTLTAQLQVLACPIEVSWERCVRLNPLLAAWKTRAHRGAWQATAWPAEAARWVGGPAYAERFWRLAPLRGRIAPEPSAGEQAQQALLQTKLVSANLYPLLWSHGNEAARGFL